MSFDQIARIPEKEVPGRVEKAIDALPRGKESRDG
jgi:hypothetical protein